MTVSDVAKELLANPPCTSDEAEGFLQRLLSYLATLPPPHGSNLLAAQEVWHCFHNERETESERPDEWRNGLFLIGSILSRCEALLSPFEIHNIAVQASVFCESQVDLYSNACVLLCCLALEKCPPRVNSRPKRWRSSLFETIRFCQRNLAALELPTLADTIIPVLVHVRNALPDGTDTLQWLTAFQCSIIQMLSACTLKLMEQSALHNDTVEFLCRGSEVVLHGKFEMLLDARYFTEEELRQEPLSHVKWIRIWTEGLAEEEDREAVVSVETEIDQVGLAEMSFFWLGWTDRPQVFSGAHLWHLLFPSVSILLNADESMVSQQHGFILLQHLLSLVPNASLAGTSKRRPDHPLATFQLLSNRIIVDAAAQNGKSPMTSLPNGSQAFLTMKALLAKYQPLYQVHLVKTLHQDCPHQGLKPKIIDLLRTFVEWSDSQALAMVWAYLDLCLKDLEGYVKSSSDGSPRILDSEDLAMEAEDFVAVVGVFRLWRVVRKQPLGVRRLQGRLIRIHDALSRALATQKSQHLFRLDLLANAIQLVLSDTGKDTMEEG